MANKKTERIDITGADLIKLIKGVYKLSTQQGIGLHIPNKEEDLTYDEARKFIVGSDSGGLIIEMDYVDGRACNFHVEKRGERLFIPTTWYDHTDAQLFELLSIIGMSQKMQKVPHLPGCECKDCNKE